MNTDNCKCVIVVNDSFPKGVVTNAASVVSLSLGKHHPEIIGQDIADASAKNHLGITTIPIPILKADSEMLRDLRSRATERESELTIVNVTDATTRTRSYQEYSDDVAGLDIPSMEFLAIGLIGGKKLLSKLTGNLGLYR